MRKSGLSFALTMVLCVLLLLQGIPVFASQNGNNAPAVTISGNTINQIGVDYHVDATLGDDDNDGLAPERAWKSFTKVNEKVFEPGDRILLKAGEVWENQQLWPKGSGAEGAPIIIDMYGDPELGRPYIAINGNVPTPVYYDRGTWRKYMDLVGQTGAVVLINQQYWEIHNLEISNDDDFDVDINVPGTTRQVVRDGISVSIHADKLGSEDDKIMNYFRITKYSERNG